MEEVGDVFTKCLDILDERLFKIHHINDLARRALEGWAVSSHGTGHEDADSYVIAEIREALARIV